MSKTILLIGGGTGGHIMPLKNLAEHLIKKGAEVHLIVGISALEKKIISENFSDLPELNIHYFRTGKIRRYLSFQNIKDFFIIFKSCFAARTLIKKIQPDTIFFKGGFVGFPFYVASQYLHKFKGNIYAHESDITPGALTKLLKKKAKQIFYNFGNPTTPLFFTQEKKSSASNQKIQNKLPHILIFGGSQGAAFLNQIPLQCNNEFIEKHKITLVTGLDKKINLIHPNITQHLMLPNDQLLETIDQADLVITRGGASIFQILEAQKKCIIIPLPSAAQNHQTLNAEYLEQKGWVYHLKQNQDTYKKLSTKVTEILQDKKLQTTLEKINIKSEAKKIAEILLQD